MKLSKRLMLSTLLIGLAVVMEMPLGQARAVTGSSMELVGKGVAKRNATNRDAGSLAEASQLKRNNDTELAAQPTELKATEVSQPMVNLVRRKRAEMEPTLPFDFHTMHLPCDIDVNGRAQVIDAFPNHCIWVWNNRHAHEGFFRVFKTYQLEAFFFGQYYERLKRFEVDPHTWDYTNTGV